MEITHINDLEISFILIDTPVEPGATHCGHELYYDYNNRFTFMINKYTGIAWIDRTLFDELKEITSIDLVHAKTITQLLEKYLNLQFTISEWIEIY